MAPDSSKADASVVAVAEMLAEMGRQFQPGEKDLHSAIREYEFLRREYPGSKYRFQALFTIGQIYKQDLGDDAAARNDLRGISRRISAQLVGSRGEEGFGRTGPANASRETG